MRKLANWMPIFKGNTAVRPGHLMAMNYLSSLLILAVVPSAPIEPAVVDGEAVEIYRCDFEAADDRDFDGWPDQWTRQLGRGFPRYIPLALTDDPELPAGTAANRCCSVQLDGGAAALQSPPLAVDPSYSYGISCRIRTAQLVGHAAALCLVALDSEGQEIERVAAAPLTGDRPWTDVAIGPWDPPHHKVRSLSVRFEVLPRVPGALFGSAFLDAVVVTRLPRVTLSADHEFHIADSANPPRVLCRVSGISPQSAEVRFELWDEMDRKLAAETVPLTSRPPTMPVDQATAAGGEASWQPPIRQRGFYRIQATVQQPEHAPLQRTTTLVVTGPRSATDPGIFGWTLPAGAQRLSVRQLADLSRVTGLGWIKFPVSPTTAEPRTADAVAWFAERATNDGIQFVGMLTAAAITPHAAAGEPTSDSPAVPIAVVLNDADQWQRWIFPVLTRLALKVHSWQLGGDHDTSYVGLPDLEQRIHAVRAGFDRFGHEARLALVWPWHEECPAPPRPSWDFLNQVADPPLTAEEIESRPTTAAPETGPWMVLEPLPEGQYDRQTRIKDLVLRMTATQAGHFSAAFHPDPFAAHTGLLNVDGTPRELFLPWRTAAEWLAGARYLGQLQFPGGSHNRVFARDGEALIVIWNDRPTTEQIFLGDPDRIRQTDVWSRQRQPETVFEDGAPQQRLEVDTLPTFVTGVNLPIAQLRIGFACEPAAFSTSVGEDQLITLRFQNPWPQGIEGQLVLRTPRAWVVTPSQSRFQAARDDEQQRSFRAFLGTNAPSGPQAIRVDFEVRAERPYRFSVYRTCQVGLDDVVFPIYTTLDESGNLLVEQHLINKTDEELSFNCLLFIPGRDRESRQISRAPPGHHTWLYVIPDGAPLVGSRLWLRIEEVGGRNRILNYDAPIEP